jgi:GTP-binding protein
MIISEEDQDLLSSQNEEIFEEDEFYDESDDSEESPKPKKKRDSNRFSYTDKVHLTLSAGRGGNGRVAWTRTRYFPKGGPSGGNGGKGGSIIIEVSKDLLSLDHFRNTRIIKALNGDDGGTCQCNGKNGQNRVIKVPQGTLIKDLNTGEIIKDLVEDGEIFEFCKGGKGGFGNEHFKSPTNRTPRNATPGKPGDSIEVEFELKLIADIGFVGLPNAGKSTLLNALTATQVKIGDYPFTTLKPNLSYIEFDDYSRVYLADIPGIIKDAHVGRGLGLEFLKHIERTKVLIFVIDLSKHHEDDPLSDLNLLRKELELHNESLLEKPFLVALNKSDLPESKENLERFLEVYPFSKDTIFPISALEKENLDNFVKAMRNLSNKPKERDATISFDYLKKLQESFSSESL